MVSGSHPCAWSLPRAQTLLRGCIFWYDWSPWSLIARGLSQESHKLASPLTWGKKPDTLHATAVDLAIKGLRAISGRLGPQELVLRLQQRTVGLGTRLRVMWQGRPWPVPTGAGFRVQRQPLRNTHNHDPYIVLSFVSSLQHNRGWQTAASPQFTGLGGGILKSTAIAHEPRATQLLSRDVWRLLVQVLLNDNLPLYCLGEVLW